VVDDVVNSEKPEFRHTYAGQQRMAELAFSILTMRANTSGGQWIDDAYGDTYGQVWTEARSIAGDEADEAMFLSMLNLADHLLGLLVATTGVQHAEWLRRLRAQHMDRDGGEAGTGSAP
jgi:hypothetical protein